jgi:hypothetical protein
MITHTVYLLVIVTLTWLLLDAWATIVKQEKTISLLHNHNRKSFKERLAEEVAKDSRIPPAPSRDKRTYR